MADLENQINKDLKILNNFQKINKDKVYPESTEIEQALIEDISRNLTDKYFRIDLLAAAAQGILSESGYKAGLASTQGSSNASATQHTVALKVNNQLNVIINEVISEIEGILGKQGVPKSTIEKQVNRSRGKTQTFIKNLNNMSKTVDPENISTKKQLENILLNLAINLENETSNVEIKNLINNFITGVAQGTVKDKEYKGRIGEAITAAAAQRLSGTVLNNVIDTVSVVGDFKSSKIIVKDNLTPSLLNKRNKLVNNSDISKDTDDYIMTTTGKQSDKVDVTISFKDQKPMNISVKNYKPKAITNTGFQNKTGNLLALLQNENKNDFINHYLNLISIKDFREDGNTKNITLLIKKIVVSKLITGYRTITAVEGNIINMAEANVFAVFTDDKDGGKVKLYNMEDILRDIFSGDKYTHINVPDSLVKSNVKIYPQARSGSQQQIQGIQARLANLVSKLNRQVSYTFALKNIE